jgi:DNA-binding MarR family transcriptional regulator
MHDSTQSPCYCTTLRRAARGISRFYDSAVQESGLGIAQYALLKQISRMEPVSLNDLSRAARLERSTLTRNIDILKKRGLIAVFLKEGKKNTHYLASTSLGKEKLEETLPRWEQAQSSMEQLFTAQDLQTLREMALKLQDL